MVVGFFGGHVQLPGKEAVEDRGVEQEVLWLGNTVRVTLVLTQDSPEPMSTFPTQVNPTLLELPVPLLPPSPRVDRNLANVLLPELALHADELFRFLSSLSR